MILPSCARNTRIVPRPQPTFHPPLQSALSRSHLKFRVELKNYELWVYREIWLHISKIKINANTFDLNHTLLLFNTFSDLKKNSKLTKNVLCELVDDVIGMQNVVVHRVLCTHAETNHKPVIQRSWHLQQARLWHEQKRIPTMCSLPDELSRVSNCWLRSSLPWRSVKLIGP